MELVRILHASDLHIAKRARLVSGLDRISAGVSLSKITQRTTVTATFKTAFLSSYDPSLLIAFAEFIYHDYDISHIQQKDAPIDVITLTGDIATSGRTLDLERARRFLEDSPDPNNPALSFRGTAFATLSAVIQNSYLTGPVAIPLLLLPGNHDRLRRAWLSGYSPGGKRFDQILKNHWDPTLNARDWGPDVKALTIQKSTLSVSIIAADFNLKNKGHREGRWYNKYAQGRVYSDAVNKLDILGNLTQATVDIQSQYPDGIVIWASHFPPAFPGISSTMKLIDDKDLITAANDHNVLAILSGHTHVPVRYRIPGMQFDVFCAGTATQHHSPLGHYFQVLEIEGNNNQNATVQLVNYKFDPARAEFLEM
jgi:3',5'-cyclic AMP phosphodiesterase CpdA